MKSIIKKIYLLYVSLIMTTMAIAQLSGTKNIPGDYATLAASIADLNIQGVGAGGVILNLVAGNPQTAPAGGFLITASGTLADQVIIQGNGNTITASAALTAGGLNDAIFKLVGADYITIKEFVMLENGANTTTTAATNNMTEWGVALLYATTTNGAQNNTVQSNTIDLNRIYQNTFGIYSNSTHSATTVNSAATATTTAGGNSGLKIYGNYIADVNIGVVVVGPTAAADNNDGLEIGGTSLNGNSITNYGTTGTFSGYINVSGSVNGILVRNTKNYNVSFNTVSSSNGGTVSGTLRGIYVPNFSTGPTGTITNSINNNIISVRSGFATGAILGIVVEQNTVNATTTLDISNNNFNTSGHTVAGSGAVTFLFNGAAALNTNINSNTFTNLSVNTTGDVTLISNDVNRPANAVCNVNNNSIVTAFSKTGSGGILRIYTSAGLSQATVIETNSNNNFSNITVTGTTAILGWSCTDGYGTTVSPSATISGNIFNNWIGGSGFIHVLAVGFSAVANISNNIISSISGGGTVRGIISADGAVNIFSNTINNLFSTGPFPVTGIQTYYPGPPPFGTRIANYSIYKNKIYNLQCNNLTGTVNGILITSGMNTIIYNNLIGDLKAPLTSSTIDAIRGINLTSAEVSSYINIYYNSIYINATSAGTNFSTSGIFHTTSLTTTTASLDLRNNIIVNLSVPNGTGITTAYRRSGTDFANYATSSNNNLFYAGIPGPANLIFSDGTNNDQSLAAYQTRVSPIDALSVTENPPFLSTSGTDINFLHINPVIATQVKNGAVPVTSPLSITDDYDSDVRDVFTPDIGADEVFCTTTSWIGSVNTAWENAGNWSCGVPTATTDVIIPGGSMVVINSIAHVRSLLLNPTANIIVSTGFGLTIHN